MPPYASRGSRLVAQILDGLVAVAIVCMGLIPLVRLRGSASMGFLLVPAILMAAAYLLLSDSFENGQSLGKRVLGIRVVDATTGQPCTVWQSFLRNILLEVLGIIDWVFIFGEKRQRLGDKAANTIVINL
jgi:uncharacterized RDD family membrane protein YckC